MTTPRDALRASAAASGGRWLVFERDLVVAEDGAASLEQLASSPARNDATLGELVFRLTRPRTFVPIAVLPPADDTIYAVQLFGR